MLETEFKGRPETEIPQEQDEDFARLSWICIRNNKVFFVRKQGGDVFFDPGCRRVSGQDDKVTLAKKIKEDLNVELVAPFELLASFCAPAYGKPDDVMVEMRCFLADYKGTLTPAPHIERIAWFTGSIAVDEVGNPQITSDAGKHILQWLSKNGHIYL